MKLTRHEQPAVVRIVGRESFSHVAAEELKIEIDGSECFKDEAPEGKIWDIDITMSIREIDA